MQPGDISVPKVFDALRTVMFLLGMAFVFMGIFLLAPDDSKGDFEHCFLLLFHIIVARKVVWRVKIGANCAKSFRRWSQGFIFIFGCYNISKQDRGYEQVFCMLLFMVS